MILINNIVMILYYVITGFFLLAILWNFFRTKKIQDAILLCIMMIPFILRLARLK